MYTFLWYHSHDPSTHPAFHSLLCAQDAYERTALIWASQKGYLDVVMALVAISADLNAKDRVSG